MKLSEARLSLASKLNIDYTEISSNELFSAADLDEWINDGAKAAWDYRLWSFTEKTWKFTLDSSMLTDEYVDYPEDAEDESIDRMTVDGGAPWEKKTWESYQAYFAANPTATDKFFAEHDRFVFFNVNAVSVDQEVNFTGKKRCPAISDATDVLPFSNPEDDDENSGNKAVILLAYAEALNSEKLNDEAKAEKQEKRAFALLDRLWEPIAERRAKAQPKDRPMFDVPNYFKGNGRSSSPTGNFNL